MKFTCGQETLDVTIDHLFVAGWTGRDQAAVQHHIDELAVLGVAPPSSVPQFYRGSFDLATQSPLIEVVGNSSSGEVEPIVVHHKGAYYVGLGSDHTDRELEAYSVAASKQVCAKPVSSELWAYDEVKDHLDEMILTCHIEENGEWVLYQEGRLATIRPLQELIYRAPLPQNEVMLCGTFASIGGLRPSLGYRMVLKDPKLGREITLEYRVRMLPEVK